ncbi:hypothetical protein [Porphyrobacter sp. AAP82]|uniref:hypothetical protein n=1 Tax=Porphyrobacter sp. AAP82 TaxID=1248917 RepID=UPI0012DE9335|nr:hypothetical protein [Porphyrobacter sp. AAP82]
MTGDANHGFAAPMAALAVALLALGLVMSLPASDRLGQELRHARAQLHVERVALSAQSRVVFLMLTEPVGQNGLEFGGPRLALDGSLVSGELPSMRRTILFDGRPYKMKIDSTNEVIVRLQDEGGLINLHQASTTILSDLISACGITGPRAQNIAAGILADRSRTSDFDWRKHVRGDERRKLEAATAWRHREKPGLYLPTAPPSVLLALTGSERRTRQILELRERDQDISKMVLLYNKNGNIIQYPYRQMGSITAHIRMSVQISHDRLTNTLPVYLYQSTLELDRDDPALSFIAKGPIVDAGYQSECFPFLEEAAQPLPER